MAKFELHVLINSVLIKKKKPVIIESEGENTKQAEKRKRQIAPGLPKLSLMVLTIPTTGRTAPISLFDSMMDTRQVLASTTPKLLQG